MAYFNRPALRQVDAQRALSSASTSFSSEPSSYGFDQRSKVSQFTDLTPLISPVASIFGYDLEPKPVPRFPDLVAWDGLTDEQWKLHSLVYKAERAIEEVERGPLIGLDEDFFRDDIWYNDDLYELDEEFDAVGAARARLEKGEQTSTTRRALEIIDSRSETSPTLSEDKRSRQPMARKVDAEEIDDYAEDFDLGDVEIPATPYISSTLGHHSILEAIEEREPESLFNETFPYPTDFVAPPTPLIRPVDGVWDLSLFQNSDPRTSTPNFISQLMMSPLMLNNPAIISSPIIYRNSIRNADPTSPVVSYLFSSRLPLPTSLLDGGLDITAALQPGVASPRDSDDGDVTPRAKVDSPKVIGLGLVGVPASMMTQGTGTWAQGSSGSCAFISGAPQNEFQKSHFDTPDGMVMTPVSFEKDPGAVCDKSVSPSSFESVRSPWDILVERLGQGAVPYAPTTLGSTIAYTGLATNIVFDEGMTVTAGSNHPAASTSFITSTSTAEASKAQQKFKGLGLRLPMGLKQRISRCSPGIPTSEACQDLANLAAPVMETNSSLFGFQGHVLSPIAEEAPLQPDLCPILTLETKPMPRKKRRNFFRRAFSFLF